MVYSKRGGRTLFDYYLRARGTNEGAVAVAANATLSLPSGHPATLVDATARFSLIPAGQSALSDDFVVLSIDRSQTATFTNLVWSVVPTPLPDFVVANLRAVSQSRVGRTQFEYELSGTLFNMTDRPVSLVATASLRSGSPIQLIDTSLDFPSVPATGSGPAAGTLTARLLRDLPLDLSDLTWTFAKSPSKADLSVQLVEPMQLPLARMPASYSLSVSNNGPSTATGINLIHQVPELTEMLSLPAGCTVSGTNIFCAIASIAPGAGALLEFSVQFGGPGVREMRASVAGMQSDSVVLNNEVWAPLAVSDFPLQTFQMKGANWADARPFKHTQDSVIRGDGAANSKRVFVGNYLTYASMPLTNVSPDTFSEFAHLPVTTWPYFEDFDNLLVTDYQTRQVYALKRPRAGGAAPSQYEYLKPVDPATGLPGGPVLRKVQNLQPPLALPGFGSSFEYYKDTMEIPRDIHASSIVETTCLVVPTNGVYRFALLGYPGSYLNWGTNGRPDGLTRLLEVPQVNPFEWQTSPPIELVAGQKVVFEMSGVQTDGGMAVGTLGWIPPWSNLALMPMDFLVPPVANVFSGRKLIRLSQPLPMERGTFLFSGWGKMAYRSPSSGEVSLVSFSDGSVTNLGVHDIGFVPLYYHSIHSGLLEHSGNEYSLVFGQGFNNSRIARYRLDTRIIETVAPFTNLGEGWMFCPVPWNDRWYKVGSHVGEFGQLPNRGSSGTASFCLTPRDAIRDLSLSGGFRGNNLGGYTTIPTILDYVVRNHGAIAFHGIKFTNTLPAGVIDTSATTSQGACQISGAQVVCDLGTVAPGASINLSVQFLKESQGVFDTLAVLTTPPGDLLPENNDVLLSGVQNKPSILIEDAVANENGGFMRHNAILSAPAPRRLQITYATRIAESPFYGEVEWEWTRGHSVFVEKGATNVELVYPIPNDEFTGGPRQLWIYIDGIEDHGINFSGQQATGTVVDDDPPPVFTLGDMTIVEGDEGWQEISIPIHSDRLSIGVELVPVIEGITAVFGEDFLPIGRSYLSRFETNTVLRVALNGDTVPEPTKTFRVTVPSASVAGLTTVPVTRIYQILDPDGESGQLRGFHVAVANPSIQSGTPFQVTVTGQNGMSGEVPLAGHTVRVYASPVPPTELLLYPEPDTAAIVSRSTGTLPMVTAVTDQEIEVSHLASYAGMPVAINVLWGPSFRREGLSVPGWSYRRLDSGLTIGVGEYFSVRLLVQDAFADFFHTPIPVSFPSGTILGNSPNYWEGVSVDEAQYTYPVNFRYIPTGFSSNFTFEVVSTSGANQTIRVTSNQAHPRVFICVTDGKGHTGTSQELVVLP